MNFDETKIAETRQFLRQSQRENWTEINFLGRTFLRHPDVFCPENFISTTIFTTHLPLTKVCSFLEMGCGTGVTAVTAAIAGCQRVVATDINPHAAENALANARANHVEGRVRAYVGSLFSEIPKGERFDLIYWNSSFVYAPDQFELKDWSDHAVFDPGYQNHRKFLIDARDHLEPNGRVMLGFSDLGDFRLLEDLCREAKCRFQVAWEEIGHEQRPVKYSLLEISYQ